MNIIRYVLSILYPVYSALYTLFYYIARPEMSVKARNES